MEAIRDFFNIIKCKLTEIEKTQENRLEEIIGLMVKTINNGNVIHLFGTGHSHILAEECFYRAGGFVPVNAIFEESLMLHAGALASSRVERLEGFAEIILDKYTVYSGDILFIFSNSGINNVPIEMALVAKERGLKVIALTNLKHSESENSRHKSGKKLYEVVDYYIDNCGDIGDAALLVYDSTIKVGSTSNIIGAAIMHGIFAEVANRIVQAGKTPPVYMSANVTGGMEYNRKMIEIYKERLKHL